MHVRSWLLALAALLALAFSLCLAEQPPADVASHVPVAGQNISKLLRNATAGEADAQFLLGRAYETGNGAPQDYSEAAHWYLQAANRGQAEAQNNLASLYVRGLGVPTDYQRIGACEARHSVKGVDTARGEALL